MSRTATTNLKLTPPAQSEDVISTTTPTARERNALGAIYGSRRFMNTALLFLPEATIAWLLHESYVVERWGKLRFTRDGRKFVEHFAPKREKASVSEDLDELMALLED